MSNRNISIEGFQLIEHRGTVSPDEFADKFRIKLQSARTWLSRWASRGYLTFIPSDDYSSRRKPGRPGGGRYKIGVKEWGNLYYDNNVDASIQTRLL